MKIFKILIIVFCFFSLFNEKLIHENIKIESEISLEVGNKIVELRERVTSLIPKLIYQVKDLNLELFEFSDHIQKKISSIFILKLCLNSPAIGPPNKI